MTALSGGQAARAGLAALLLSRYDVLLLDEPTNDLDLDGLERLERFVAGLARRPAGGRQPRPGVPGPHGHPGRRAGPRPAAGRRLRRRLRQPTSPSARSRAGTRGRPTRSTTTSSAALKDRAADAAQLDGRRACATPGARPTDNDKIGRNMRAETSEKQAAKARQTRAGDRAAGRRRGAAQGVGAADDDRRGAALGRGGGVAVAARWCAAGRSRSARSTPRSTGRTGS